MATARNRYRFPDRTSAEEAEARKDRESMKHLMTLNAQLNGAVQWFKGERNHVGAWGQKRMDGGYVVVRFMDVEGDPPSPRCHVYTFDEARAFWLQLGRLYPADDEQRELRDLLGQAVYTFPT